MRVLVTGAKGFIGKNLVAELKNEKNYEIFEYDIHNSEEELENYIKDADFICNLAGINRPENTEDFMVGNSEFIDKIIFYMDKYKNYCPIMSSSSIQAETENVYGKSKKSGEDKLFDFAKKRDVNVMIYRFPNVFGKWCKPNYNSAIATFCYNIANDLPIVVNDPDVILNLVYIDDVVCEIINAIKGKENRINEFCEVSTTHRVKLGKVAELIYSFKESRNDKTVPDMSDSFTKKLYSTYLSYLPIDKFSYPLKMNIDNRGSFTEFIRTVDRGQVSINISKPHIVKGNHWHHTKNEKFLVVSGDGIIRFRDINSDKIIEYKVSGNVLEVVDIPTGYTHNIENTGDVDMVTVMWANEAFDSEHPDTFFMEV